MKIIGIVLLALCLVVCGGNALADEINLHMDWTYNGESIDGRTVNGFKLLRTNPSGTDEDVLTIEGAHLRTFDGVMEVEEGRSTYYLVATTVEGNDSPRSVGYPFEYMKPSTPAFPAPTVIIRFN